MTSATGPAAQAEDLDKELKRAELNLRRQQLILQQDNHTRGRWANPLLIAVLAAFLAALANLWTTMLSAENTRTMEQRKWEQARLDEHTKSTSIVVAEFSRRMASGYQEASWVLWKRIKDPARFTEADSVAYDRAMKEILPAVLSSHVQIATLDPGLYLRLAPLVADLAQTDEKLATLLTRIPLRSESSAMQALHTTVSASLRVLGQRIATAYIEERPLEADVLGQYRGAQGERLPPTRSSRSKEALTTD